MKWLNFVLLAVAFSFCLNGSAQDAEKLFEIKLSGFVKTDVFYDSRQTVNIREGHFMLYPDKVNLDVNGVDINAKDHLGILSIQSRLSGKITGPDVFKAKTSALIEADFFGNENGNFSDVNGLRLRHAFVKLNWKTTELLVGQFWHPMFAYDCFPDVVSFNTGVPFQPFARNPQIRLTQKFDNFKMIFAVAEQRDFTSAGPDGSHSKYLSNSVLPDLNMHWQYTTKWAEKNELLIGVGGEYKMLVPRLSFQYDKDISDGKDTVYSAGDNKVSSYAFSVYSKLKMPAITCKAHFVYGNNLTDLVMLGGYAVKSSPQPSRLTYEYTTANVYSIWGEVSTNGKIQAGIFGGFTKNLGTTDENIGIYYSRGSNINKVYRISPRVVGNFEKFRISTEFEYTVAEYGKADVQGVVNSNLSTVSNLRVLLAFYYFF